MDEQKQGVMVHEEEEEVPFNLPVSQADDTQPLIPPVDSGAEDDGDEEIPLFVAPPDLAELEAPQNSVEAGGTAEPEVDVDGETEEVQFPLGSVGEFGEEEEDDDSEEVGLVQPEEEPVSIKDLEKEIEELSVSLDAQAENLMAQNRRAILSSALFIILVAIYMVWAGGQLKHAFRPEAVADAATGVAKNAIPQASESLELMLEDGALDIAERFGDRVISGLPDYREGLVKDVAPAMESLSNLLAERLMAVILDTNTQSYFESASPLKANQALDAMLVDLDERLAVSLADPLSKDRVSLALESTPLARQSLEILENGRDETQDRDLLLNWLTVIAENP